MYPYDEKPRFYKRFTVKVVNWMNCNYFCYR